MIVTKNILKSSANFKHYVKKIEAQAKKWFLYKKTCNALKSLNTKTDESH